jgi:hypothetical protein
VKYCQFLWPAGGLGCVGCSIPLDYGESELCNIMLKTILIDRNSV